jgi:hypothetical protein
MRPPWRHASGNVVGIVQVLLLDRGSTRPSAPSDRDRRDRLEQGRGLLDLGEVKLVPLARFDASQLSDRHTRRQRRR